MKRIKISLPALLLALALLTAGCAQGAQSGTAGGAQSGTAPGTVSSFPAKQITALSFEKRSELVGKPAEGSKNDAVTCAVQAMAGKTAPLMLSSGKNSCFSPVSIYFALSALCLGADGETEKEILSYLSFDSEDELADRCEELFTRLLTDDGTSKLLLTDSLWVSPAAGIKKEYAERCAEKLFSSLKTADFTDVSGTKKQISDFISENTNGKLSFEEELSPDTVAFILNTLYFNSQWITAFDKNMTAKDVFYTGKGEVSCDFMRGSFRTDVLDGEDMTAFALYMEDGSRMVFILPDEGKFDAVLSDLFGHISAAETRPERVNVIMPRFTAKGTVEMSEVLQSLGVRRVFGGGAELYKMSDEGLFASRVYHGTFMRVYEEGAEAAAYTGIALTKNAAPASQPIEIKLDRPFIYVTEAFDGTPLFCGVCADPSAE